MLHRFRARGVRDAASGYAVEYDAVRPTELTTRWKRDGWRPLSCGQLNGTSGYEEAAAQGLMAAPRGAPALGREPLRLAAARLHR